MNATLPPNTDKHLAVLIDTNSKSLTSLIAILKLEKLALEKKDYKNYQAILVKKNEELPKLAKLDSEIKNLFAQAGLGCDKQSIHTLLLKMQPTIRQALLKKWSAMVDLLKECEHLNKVTQRIVYHTKQSNDRLLSLIKGEAVHSKTYSASGKANVYANNERCLAQA